MLLILNISMERLCALFFYGANYRNYYSDYLIDVAIGSLIQAEDRIQMDKLLNMYMQE